MANGQADEQALLLRVARGDKAVYTVLVRRHQSAVFNVAFRMLGRFQDAEDAAQEAFLRAYQAIKRFDPSRPFAPWIKRITVNVCLNWLESAKVRPHLLASDLGDGDGDRVGVETWPSLGPTPEQQLVARERSEAVRAAMLRLPPQYRAAIELRHFQELSYVEIAKTMRRPLNSVKSDLFRGRKMLAELIGDP